MSSSFSRRDLMAGAAVLAVGVGLASTVVAADAPPTASGPTAGKAYLGKHQAQPLPFDPAKLDGISEKLMSSHYENNYKGAITALNGIEPKIPGLVADKDWAPSLLGEVKREELLRTGSMIMHQHYFGNLGGDGKVVGEMIPVLGEWFGSAAAWEAEFRKVAIGLGGGSGWAVLSFNLFTGELHNRWAWDHHTGVAWEAPLLVCDMYEHAYAMDFGAAAPKYVDAFMRNVNWTEVNRRLSVARRLSTTLNS
jgi:superoxide dismutase, Fe-Mn family